MKTIVFGILFVLSLVCVFTAAFDFQGGSINASVLPSYSNSISSDSDTFSVTISPTSVTLDVNQSQRFTSIVSNGTFPYSYQWYLNGSAVGTGASWTFTPSSAGSYTVYLNVTDTVGVTATSDTVTVTALTVPEFPSYLILLLFIAVILLAILAVALALHYTREAKRKN